MKIISTILWMMLAAGLCFGQTAARKIQARPDFSGTWVLDISKSVTGLAKGPTTVKNLRFSETTLDIAQQGSEISVTEKGASDSSRYYTDGRIGTTAGSPDDRPKARFSRGQLVITTTTTADDIMLRGRKLQQTITEAWALSGAGKTLTQTLTFTNNSNIKGPGVMRKVFRKKE
jgi:hypothetical protein